MAFNSGNLLVEVLVHIDLKRKQSQQLYYFLPFAGIFSVLKNLLEVYRLFYVLLIDMKNFGCEIF